MGRLIHLDEDVLRQVLRLRGITQHAIDDIHHRLLILVHQFGKSVAIALLDAQHQGGIRVQFDGHSQIRQR